MKIMAIRHLPTRFNIAGLLQGKRDEPILQPSQEDYNVISENRKKMDAFRPFDKMLVSSLRRTAMTADCYGYQEDITIEPLLDELNFGIYEGKHRKEMLDEIGEQWINDPLSLILGEPLTNLQKRVSRFLYKYHRSDRLLIFGHAAWLRALKAYVRHGSIHEMNRFNINNNELLMIDVE